MKGFILNYKYKDKMSLTLLNHKLYGRIMKCGKHTTYVKGMLHNTKFYRIKNGKIFITDKDVIDRITLNVFTNEYKIYPCEIDTKSIMTTGEEYWQKIANKNKVIVNGWTTY